MTLVWVIGPVVNGIAFFKVPIRTFQENGEKGMGIGTALIFPVALVTIIIVITRSQRKNRITV